MTPGLTLKSLLVGSLVVVGSVSAADAPKITVTNIDKIVSPEFLGDKPVKFAPAAQTSNVGTLAGQGTAQRHEVLGVAVPTKCGGGACEQLFERPRA